MQPSTPLPDWDTVASLSDDALPLLGTALLIARDEYPDLDAPRCVASLDRHADDLRELVEAIPVAPLKMHAINQHLFDELGYSGDQDAYYDPRNSYLNEVVDRRLGNPISLAVVQMEVARRLRVPLDGISFPGHFLVRMPVDDGVLVMDPFNRGRPLGVEELRDRAQRHLGDEPDDEALHRILNPASHRSMMMRVLRNLHGAYREARDWERATRSADRLLRLSPNDGEALRERGLCYLELGHRRGARDDLARYLQQHPSARDAREIRERLIALGGAVPRAH